MPTPTLTPTPAPTPSPTPTPTPISQPLATSTPTPTPTPDERYAAIVHTTDPAKQQWFLDALGTKWFLDYTYNVSSIPSGHTKVLYVGSPSGPTPQEIHDLVEKAPGAVWYILGEPNRKVGRSASDVADQLHDLYTAIREADPTARLTSPSVLNWDFTCIGCAGYQTGHAWVEEFRSEHLARYGEEPPVDIWAIDLYPLDWHNLPTVNPQIVIDQIAGMRQYLDGIPAQRGKPIWITELALHWGWDAMEWGVEGCGSLPTPAGTYQTNKVIQYLRTVFNWLETNATSMNIEMWFVFITYHDIATCNPDAYAGVTLFEGPDPEANLTPVGEFFRKRALGLVD